MPKIYIMKDEVGYFSATGDHERQTVKTRKPKVEDVFSVTAVTLTKAINIAKQKAAEKGIKVPDLDA